MQDLDAKRIASALENINFTLMLLTFFVAFFIGSKGCQHDDTVDVRIVNDVGIKEPIQLSEPISVKLQQTGEIQKVRVSGDSFDNEPVKIEIDKSVRVGGHITVDER